ncbi:MAG: transaldolase [Desulfobacterales bacterium C00003060]|nr:MAG: transaldolase [Desulfobacterales bacterium S3730MH5]OEU79992.1 MAG: transaldolase [Desulfobacterales bacterium S5133MH4]OEU81417.1 MAG: transaldolase [Desulfobacterales bacterium C00003060]
MNTDNNLKGLLVAGQSPWYDNIDRRLIQNGKFEELFALGITGVTSNPSIFEKAVRGSSVYDSSIRELAKAGKSPDEICNLITVQDIQSAADMLYDTYKATNGRDGYVSLEVDPYYAHDQGKTIDHAMEIHKDVARPNLMIKVPGTKEGFEAIRVLAREGINVNVTLLFSLKHYEASAMAYIDGLSKRLEDGNSVENVCSVASVFVSRVDNEIDKILEGLEIDGLKGRIAVANAKMIYQRFKELFYDGIFGDLASKGARIQRVLWGSTSTKNPAYSDVKYVDELIGKDTINTIPHSTVEFFLDHGTPILTIEQDLAEARQYLDLLQQQGIDLDRICDEIQKEGVDAFCVSYKELVDAVADKAAH